MSLFKKSGLAKTASKIKNNKIISLVIALLVVVIIALVVYFKVGNSVQKGQADKITDMFVKKGVKQCEDRLRQINKFFLTGNKAGVVTFANEKEANKNIISSSLEIINKDNTISYLSASFAPVSGESKCGAVYDLTQFWSEDCKDVAVNNFKAKGNVKVLLSRIFSYDLNQNSKVFFIPTGKKSCTTIKKEILY